MNLKEAVLTAKILRGSGDSGETIHVNVTGASPSIAAQKNQFYICNSTITALTISSIPDEGLFNILFKAGTTAPQITGPACISYREDDEVQASKWNEISYHCFKIGSAQFCQGLMVAVDGPAPEGGS